MRRLPNQPKSRCEDGAADGAAHRDEKSPSTVSTIGTACLLVVAALALTTSLAGGLSRVGFEIPSFAGPAWVPAATAFHAALMIGGLMGTVIGVEQAVSAKLRWAFVAPVASGLSVLALLIGQAGAGVGLLIAAGVVLTGAHVFVVRRERTNHATFSLAAAVAWLGGSLLLAAKTGGDAAFALWFAFLIITVAAERVPMKRLQSNPVRVQRGLRLALAVLLLSAAWSAIAPVAGGTLYGSAVWALAIWFAWFDRDQRGRDKDEMRRYIAASSLSSTAWLAVGGVAWAATALGVPFARDAALHALGLGFVVSTMMGHAPRVLRSVAHVDLRFGRAFYVPLAALQLSLLVRVGLGALDPDWRAIGAALNVAAIALFVGTVAGAVLLGRVQKQRGARLGTQPAP